MRNTVTPNAVLIKSAGEFECVKFPGLQIYLYTLIEIALLH